jgi:hypothetical protein
MSRKRPSGDGSNSRRFATVNQPDGSKLKIPVVKDAGTFIYMCNDDGGWSEKPICTVLDLMNVVEVGSTVELEEAEPGKGMGNLTPAQVVDQRIIISIDRSGKYSKYGQVKRLLLLDEVESYNAVMTAQERVHD